MTTSKTFPRMLLAGACLASVAPPAVFAAEPADDQSLDFVVDEEMPDTATYKRISSQKISPYDNQIDLRVRATGGASAWSGRYNGLSQSGVGVVGSWWLRQRDAWNSGGTNYYEFRGDNFDLSGRNTAPLGSTTLRAGEQGRWGINLGYDAMTFTQSRFQSVFNSDGTPATGWTQGFGGPLAALGAGNAVATPPAVLAALQKQEAVLRRDSGLLGLNFREGDWQVSTNLKHEHKEGIQQQTMNSGSSFSFPLPVNWDNDRLESTLAYTTRDLQASLSYNFLKFTENESDFHPTRIYTGATIGNAVYALPPSTVAHRMSGMLGYNLGPDTRVNANMVTALEWQDDTIPAAYGSTYPSGNPTTLDRIVKTYFANVGIVSRPLPRFDTKLSYTIDARDSGSNSPLAITGISGLNDTTATRTIYALPQSWTKQTAKAEAGYSLFAGTRVTLGYTFNNTERSFALVRQSQENTVSARINSSFGGAYSWMLGYEHGIRTGAINARHPWYYMVNAANGQTLGLSTATYQAKRNQDLVKGRLSAVPMEDLSLGINGRVVSNDYPSTLNGVHSEQTVSAGPDVSYTFANGLSLYAYYNYEQIFRNQRGASTAGAYNAVTTTEVHSAGLGGDYQVTDDLKLSINYNYSYGDIGYYLSNAPATAMTVANTNYAAFQLPNTVNEMHSVKLDGEYALFPDVTLLFGYSLERAMATDWGLNWASGTLTRTNGAILGDEGMPSYLVHTATLGARFKW